MSVAQCASLWAYDRRYEELTQWEAYVANNCPDLQIPKDRKGRNRLHQQVDPVLLQDPEFRGRHAQFRTNIALAIALVAEAIRNKVPFGVVVCDALVPGGGLGPWVGPTAQGLDQPAENEPRAGNGQFSAARYQRLGDEAA